MKRPGTPFSRGAEDIAVSTALTDTVMSIASGATVLSAVSVRCVCGATIKLSGPNKPAKLAVHFERKSCKEARRQQSADHRSPSLVPSSPATAPPRPVPPQATPPQATLCPASSKGGLSLWSGSSTFSLYPTFGAFSPTAAANPAPPVPPRTIPFSSSQTKEEMEQFPYAIVSSSP